MAALAGATAVALAHVLHLSPIVAMMVGGALCFALRFAAIHFGWHLPGARPPQLPALESQPKERRDQPTP